MRSLFRFRRRNPGQVWAWATYDFANSAFATTILAVVFNAYYAGTVAGGSEGTMLWGTRVPGATMFTLFMAASMILIALTSPILAAFSDLSGLKKRMLGLHLGLGVVSTALLYTVDKGEWLWGGILFVVAQIGFAGGNVFYNAMLYDVADPEDYGKVSGLGWAWGYIGGGLLLGVNLIMLRYPGLLGLPEGFFGVQHCFVSVAIWWVVFAIPIFRYVPTAKGKIKRRIGQNLRAAFGSLGEIFRRLRDLPNLTKYFIAFLLYNDGIETIIVMAAIFANQELAFSSSDLIVFFLVIQFVGFFGSLFFGWLVDRIGGRRAILASLIGWLVVVVWAWKLGTFGDAVREFWILGVITGLVMGGSQAASRSLQATLIPPGRSAEFFSFFGISGKFAGAVGPLIFGLAVLLTGSLREGILSLLVLFGGGFLMLLIVKEEKGRVEALSFEQVRMDRAAHEFPQD
ncbi:MFS transporter [bacterium]|nr:MFS transporter [bacterium]MBU1983587.1 MFS transporter [bacterium]